jgi:hypothetical protein
MFKMTLNTEGIEFDINTELEMTKVRSQLRAVVLMLSKLCILILHYVFAVGQREDLIGKVRNK